MTFNNDSATPSFSDILKTIPELNRTLPYDHTDHDTISQGLIDCQVDNLSSNPSPDLPIVLFDGGMGTTLEDVYHQDISNNALWSARLIDNDPNVLIQLHLDYLRSGSKIFSTATYQCAFETFSRQGYSDEQAGYLMREAVRLADQARIQFMEQRQQETSRTGLVRPLLGLSLGPYGATLSPAQEFDGLYPPPYGPCGFNNPNNMKTKSTSFFNSPPPYLSTTSETSIALEEKAESELCSFHLGRLLVFAEDEATWSRIDCVMFETVPLLREGRAIRRAVGMLQGTMRLRVKGWRMKPWWVSFVYPEGKCPEEVWTGGPRICMAKIVNEMMKDSLVGANSEFARPSALGINCTQPEFISSLVNEMTDALGSLPADDAAARPWLTLYPNGGLVYDITTQRWIRHPEKGVDSEQKYWAESVLSAARRSMPANGATVSPWSGIILGGCCKTGPAHITELGRICYSTRV